MVWKTSRQSRFVFGKLTNGDVTVWKERNINKQRLKTLCPTSKGISLNFKFPIHPKRAYLVTVLNQIGIMSENKNHVKTVVSNFVSENSKS